MSKPNRMHVDIIRIRPVEMITTKSYRVYGLAILLFEDSKFVLSNRSAASDTTANTTTIQNP